MELSYTENLYLKFHTDTVGLVHPSLGKSNVAWVADITVIELKENKKFYVFLCIDIHTNNIIAHTSSQKIITSQSIIECLKKAIDKT